MARRLFLAIVGVTLYTGSVLPVPLSAQKKDAIPHAQDKMPGPALSPAEALKKMTVPPGFSVELVAAEPDIVNPVAMTFDERGRIWITESLEYPRASAGPGKDRVKVLESTKGDAQYDKITIFAEGLNIPSGIAVGHGGVWIANAPDILFYKIGPDGKAAGKPEVVVTGFGRADTHELPNSLTWGPDGWLYGLNGVFNHSHVKHKGKEYRFTCALFRIHPKTHDFELFAEGTSNPWGIAFDTEGSAFVSACVIDHLWHLVETGYYHRQGGPYPPFTWKIESIVKHKHQKAAYCGLHFFDSDAYPPEYREKLYMGNIHGGCINSDELTRNGSTYFAKPRPDFLTANDPWFMPVVQKTGPDGCLYILDWYDRYHCYQDARRDPNGIDRLRGRLYRVRYKDSPPAGRFDLGTESDEQLLQRLQSPNVYLRDVAQRVLTERFREYRPLGVQPKHLEGWNRLQHFILDQKIPRKSRMHALWVAVGSERMDPEFLAKLLAHPDAGYRAWGVRAAGNLRKVSDAIRERVDSMASDPSPDVQLQVTIAAHKIEGLDAMSQWTRALASCAQDKLIPHVVWQNLHPTLEHRAGDFAGALKDLNLNSASGFVAVLPRALDRILASSKPDLAAIGALLAIVIGHAGDGKSETNNTAATQALALLTSKVQNREIAGERLEQLKPLLLPMLARLGSGPEWTLAFPANMLRASLGDPDGLAAARQVFMTDRWPEKMRLGALEALVATGDPNVLKRVTELLAQPKEQAVTFLTQMISALGRLDDPRVADVLLAHYAKLPAEVRPGAVDLLTQRTAWSKRLMTAVREKQILPEALSVNQVRKLLAGKDAEIVKQVRALWGTLREDRNPEREKVVADMRGVLKKTPGDAVKGLEIYKTQCAKCHKIHGEGQDVGPDITSNGRADFEQLLSNVFDPSLVIGAAYQGVVVSRKNGQVLLGLLVEDNAQRVVLKMEGGKVETIPRGEIDEMAVSKVSLMPEGVEKTLKPQEIADLFAFLALDRPPGDPKARKIPGSPR